MLVEGETRGELTAVTQEDPFLLGRIHLPKVTAPEDEMELAALVRTAKDYFDAYARASQQGQPGDDCVHPGWMTPSRLLT